MSTGRGKPTGRARGTGPTAAALTDLLDRAATWPADAQEDLLEIGLEIEAAHKGSYRSDTNELAAIDEGLAQLDRGEVASDSEVRKAFAAFRRG